MEYLCQCHCKTARPQGVFLQKSVVSSKEWIKFTMHRKTSCRRGSAQFFDSTGRLLYAYGLIWLVQELQNCHLNLCVFFRLWHQTLHFKQRVPESFPVENSDFNWPRVHLSLCYSIGCRIFCQLFKNDGRAKRWQFVKWKGEEDVYLV